ncbi:PadR family transcriptional regulator [Corynebacterium sp. ZY180755]
MAIKYALLMLIAKDQAQSATASRLQHAFNELTDGLWPLNIGQVSQTLSRLERDELIEKTGEEKGRTGSMVSQYAITAQGQHTLDAWWASSITKSMTDRDELVTKIALAVHENSVDLTSLLDSQRMAVFKQIRELNNQAAQIPITRNATRLLIERQIFDLEAEARWLDRVEALEEPKNLGANS